MKVFHLLDIPWWSGLSAYAMECAFAHQELKHEVFWCCQKNTLPYKQAQKKGLKTLPISGRKFYQTILNLFLIMFYSFKYRPDYFVVHTGGGHFVAFVLSFIIGAKIVRTRATAQVVRQSFFNRLVYKKCSAIICASQNLKQSFLQRLGQSFKDKTHVIYPPISSIKLKSKLDSVLTLVSLPPTVPLKIGMLARLDPVKGHTYFLQAAAQVQKKFPDVEWHLAGAQENISWGQLLKEIHDLNLKNVYYHGFLPVEKIPQFLNSCAIGVLSSIGSEELSRAALEWMAFGKAVIATDVGSIAELVQNEKSGFIVPAKNSEKMAQKIEELLSKPDQMQQIKDFNYSRVKTIFSPQIFVQSWGPFFS